MDQSRQTIQTEQPHKQDSNNALLVAALEELNHFQHRADTPPTISTLDPNLSRCKEHLEALKDRMEEENGDTRLD